MAGIGIVIAELAGYFAIRRASRLPPVTALPQAGKERRWPRLARLLFGLSAFGGGIGLLITTLLAPFSPIEEIELALNTALSFMIGVALLGPMLVAAAELALRLPVRLLGGAAGRLALADVRIRPRRVASAVQSVALAVTLIGTIYLADATQSNAAALQGSQRLAASAVVSVPGPGLAPAALTNIKDQSGIADAVGLTPAAVFVPYPGSDNAAGEAITGGPLSAVLDLKVTSGSLNGFGLGDIALSRLETGNSAVDVQVGQFITAYLPDGTPYRAKVTAIYDRSLGFGDVIIPADAAGGGHLGTPALGEILVRASAGIATTALDERLALHSSRFPGLSVVQRAAVLNAQAQLNTAQNSYANKSPDRHNRDPGGGDPGQHPGHGHCGTSRLAPAAQPCRCHHQTTTVHDGLAGNHGQRYRYRPGHRVWGGFRPRDNKGAHRLLDTDCDMGARGGRHRRRPRRHHAVGLHSHVPDPLRAG